jgi:predicted MFS family arabinose efflux permease
VAAPDAAPATPGTQQRRLGTFHSLRYRNFRLYFIGQVISFSGNHLQDTALPWLVLQMTHSALDVGLLVFCRYGPFLVGGLYGGLIADRFDNRRVLIGTQIFSMIIASVLAVVTLTGHAQLWLVYCLAALTGAQLVFDNPSRWAMVYRLVGPDDLQNAVALNQGLQNTARIVGPAIGGVLIATFGVGWCFAANAVSFLAVLGALLLIRTSELFDVERAPVDQHPIAALREGLAFVHRSLDLRVVMSISAVFGLFGFSAMRTLLAVLAADTLDGGAKLFGILFAAYGTGAVVGALVTATAAAPSYRRLFTGAFVFSIPMLGLAVVPDAAAAGVLLFVCGLGWSIWQSRAMAQVQLAAPDHLRGRILALYAYTLLATTPFGALLGGWLTTAGGTGLAFGLCGIAGVGITMLSIRVSRHARGAALAAAQTEEALG